MSNSTAEPVASDEVTEAPPRAVVRLPNRPSAGQWIGLAIILAIAGALRTYDLGRLGFWHDELCTMEVSAGRGLAHKTLSENVILDSPPPLTSLVGAPPWTAVWTSMSRDIHPPVYFLLVRFWREAFGDSDSAVRSLSLVASLVALLLLFDVVQLLQGTSTALWACVIMAVANPQILNGQEARSYALMMVWGLALLDAVVRIERYGLTALRGATTGAFALLLVMTHYFGAPTAAAAGIYALVRLRGRARMAVLASLVGAAVIFLAIWGAQLHAQGQHVGDYAEWSDEPAAGHASNTLMRVAMVPSRLLNEPIRSSQSTALLGAVMYVLPLILLRARRDLLLWYLAFVTPIAAVAALDLWRGGTSVQYVRYLLLACPPLYALTAGLLTHGRGFIRYALPLLSTLSCVLAMPTNVYAVMKDEWRDMAADMHERLRSGDVIVFVGGAGQGYFPGQAYMGLSHYLGPNHAAVLLLTGELTDDLRKQLATHPHIWIVAQISGMKTEKFLPEFKNDRSGYYPLTGELHHMERRAG